MIYLAAAGALGVVLGSLWGNQFLVIKKIWTSTYVLIAGGYSALLLALSYQMIEIWKYRAWAQPFIWIGTNSITIYMAAKLIDFEGIARRIAGDPERHLGACGPVVIAIGGPALQVFVSSISLSAEDISALVNLPPAAGWVQRLFGCPREAFGWCRSLPQQAPDEI